MRRAALSVLLVPVLFCCGCGGSGSASASLPTPRHGGSILALPGDRGFVELMTERPPPPARGQKVAPAKKTRILAYFYKADGTTEMSPVPSDVSLRLGTAASGTDVKLSAEPNQPGMMASEPGAYPDELRGEIALTLDGQPVKAEFLLR